MDDYLWLGLPDGCRQFILVERVGDSGLGAERPHLLVFLGVSNQGYHLVPILYQMWYENLTDHPGAACDKNSHALHLILCL